MDVMGADPYTWRRIIRRARLGSSVTLVASILADFADPDGTRIRPGNKNLAAACEVGDKTVRRGLERLRELGLVERVFSGSKSGRKGLADEYRLTIPGDLTDRVPMLTPDETPGPPVTVTGGEPGDNPVENPGTPVTDTGDSGPADTGTPVTRDGTPVTDARNTGHHDRPPNQAPTTTTPTNKHDRSPSRRPELEGTGPLLVATAEKNDLESENGETRYKTASTILGRLHDLGAEFMDQAGSDHPGAPLAQIVIHAARLAVKGIPA